MRDWLQRPVTFGLWLFTILLFGISISGAVYVYSQLQKSRVQASEALCLRFNRDHVAIQGLVRQGNSRGLRLVKKALPVTPDCHAFALEAVKHPHPQPTPTPGP